MDGAAHAHNGTTREGMVHSHVEGNVALALLRRVCDRIASAEHQVTPIANERTRLRVTAREADKFRADTSLQTPQADLVLLQKPRRIIVGILCLLLLRRFDDLGRPRADLVEGGPREPNNARCEEARSLRPTRQSD